MSGAKNTTADNLDDLIDRMSLEEQVQLLSGQDFWSIAPLPRLGIGSLRVTDGPNGARGGGSLVGGVKSAAFPVGIAIGASWDPALAGEIGAAIAQEARAKGAHMLLGPTVNIHRSVTNGRNFECFSEDPVLTAQLAASYIARMQAEGVAATIKHFVANESEVERVSISSEVDERTLREVYLVPFEVAVKEAGVWGVMSAYNKLCGTFTSEHSWLLTEVLRGDWGYDGMVMSDWFGSHSTEPSVNAGLELEMPGPTRDRGDKLVKAVKDGTVSRETLRARVRAMLRLMERCGALHDLSEPHEAELNKPEHRALIRRAGADAAVLLKNEGSVLPLSPDGSGTIAVIGPNAKTAQIMGGGSAQLNPYYRVSPYDGIVNVVGEDRVLYAAGSRNQRFRPLYRGTFRAEWFDNQDLSGSPVFEEDHQNGEAFLIGELAEGKVDPRKFSLRLRGVFTPEVSGEYEIGLVAAGFARLFVDGELVVDAATDWQPGATFFEEGCDERIGTALLRAGQTCEVVLEFVSKQARNMDVAGFRLGIGMPLPETAIPDAASAARDADAAIVFVGRNGEWDTEGSDLKGIALPGRQDELVAAVAAANPNTIVVLQTGGPVEMPWAGKVRAILQAWYPGQEAGNSIADVIFGLAEPRGRLPQSFPVRWADNPTFSDDPAVYPGASGKVRYDEGVFIGYRHYDRAGIAPLFPFGHGLGYTEFGLSGLQLDDFDPTSDKPLGVTVELANTGDREGATVVQLYLGDPEASVERPEKELKTFAKMALAPGERRTLRFDLNARDFAFYDVAARCWRVEPGRFDVMCGFSAGDIRVTASTEVTTGVELPV